MKKHRFSNLLTFAYLLGITSISLIVSNHWWRQNYDHVMRGAQKVLYRLTVSKHNIAVLSDTMNNKSLQKHTHMTKQTVQKDTFVFDTALYYAIWDEIIQKYNLIDEDSMVIDSLVLIEMKQRQSRVSNDRQISEGAILTDRLIQVVYQFPRRLEQLQYSRTYSDSIFFNIIENTLYTIEYWESPLQFKGFRLQDKKVTIYGLPQKAQIYVLPDRTLALAIDTTLYPLTEKSTFTMIK